MPYVVGSVPQLLAQNRYRRGFAMPAERGFQCGAIRPRVPHSGRRPADAAKMVCVVGGCAGDIATRGEDMTVGACGKMLQAVDSMIVPGCSLAAHEWTLSLCFDTLCVFNLCGGASMRLISREVTAAVERKLNAAPERH